MWKLFATGKSSLLGSLWIRNRSFLLLLEVSLWRWSNNLPEFSSLGALIDSSLMLRLYLFQGLESRLQLTSCFELVVDPVYHGDSILGRLLFDFTYVIPAGCFQAFRWLFISRFAARGDCALRCSTWSLLEMFNLLIYWWRKIGEKA
jgi:hypothetical protein